VEIVGLGLTRELSGHFRLSALKVCFEFLDSRRSRSEIPVSGRLERPPRLCRNQKKRFCNLGTQVTEGTGHQYFFNFYDFMVLTDITGSFLFLSYAFYC